MCSPAQVQHTCTITIEASMNEPHTSELNGVIFLINVTMYVHCMHMHAA